jgi:hypothetical protein
MSPPPVGVLFGNRFKMYGLSFNNQTLSPFHILIIKYKVLIQSSFNYLPRHLILKIFSPVYQKNVRIRLGILSRSQFLGDQGREGKYEDTLKKNPE